jgi:c-di-AMP phosphodiesterase-like protein
MKVDEALKGSCMTPAFSDQEIQQIANGTSTDIAKWVEAIARERNIYVRRMTSDRFARAVSRLSDAETDLDQVEELLVALGRLRVITPFQRGLLQVKYLR